MTNIWILIVINIVSIFLASFLSQIGKNIAIKKTAKEIAKETKLGENEALKKDIEDISGKIKSVETTIQEFSSKKQDLFFQYKNAIVDYANDLTSLIEWKFKAIPLGQDLISPIEIRNKFKDFIEGWNAVCCSYRRIILFSSDDSDFIELIYKQFLFVIEQYKITISYYDVLLGNSIIVGDNKSPTPTALHNMTEALKEYTSQRDSGIEKDSIKAYSSIMKSLHEHLVMKYNCK